MAGLIGDPSRAAHDSLRGYVYQILRSVLVWLDLGDEEQLFLEGAEDLDRIDAANATTEQVKDTAASGNITLRTPSVLDAINNFWKHRSRNPSATIRFRYVTTSGIGVEQGAPFGDGVGGLAIWNTLRDREAAPYERRVQSMIEFLLSNAGLSSGVRQFLMEAPPSEVLASMIRPMEWTTGQEDCFGLVRQIKDRLVVHGHAASISPADSEVAFDALYTAAFDAAKQKDGTALTRAQFMRIFAGATGVHVPKQDLISLIRAVTAASPGEPAIRSRPMLLEGAPPLPHPYFRRETLELRILEGIASGTVMLHGSTGSGKTLSAASALRSSRPLWLTLRDLPPAEAKFRLAAATQSLRDGNVARTLVVDDIDALSDPRSIEGALGALWHCQEALGGRMVITADRPLPARLADAVRLTAGDELRMQPFDTEEIEQFLRESDCPEDMATVWSKVLEVSTSGHPQLVSVRVRALIDKGFSSPGVEDLLGTAGDLDRIKFEARRLISELPDSARELLLRASLVTGRMTRQRLLAIGRLEASIAEPGIAVDTISGPWLETTDDNAFRVSPLARGVAEQLRGQDWTKAMHGQLAWTYLLDRTLCPWDVSSILMHCYIAGTAGPLMYVLHGMFGADEQTWAAVATACEFFVSLGTDSELPFKTQIDVFGFRLLQYRIAAETDAEKAMIVALKMDGELAAAPNDDLGLFFRFLHLSQLLSVTKVRYPITTVIARSFEFYDVANALQESFPERMARAGMKLEEDLPAGGYAQFAAVRLFIHLQTLDEFVELLKALRGRSSADARMFLESLAAPDDMASVLVDRLWLEQYGKQDPQWELLRDTLREAFAFCVLIQANQAARAIAPALLRTIGEQLDDSSGALAEVERIRPVVEPDAICLCAIAKVVSDAGDYSRAKDIWLEALPRWPKADADIGYAFANRAAAIAAGRHGDWALAADRFGEAGASVKEGTRPTFTIGLAVDASFAKFMAGTRGDAVSDLGEVVSALEPMQGEYDREPLLSLQRRTGGMLAALVASCSGERNNEELSKLVGTCSNLDPFETDAPVAPTLDVLRLDLIRLELACGSSIQASIREAEKFRACRVVSFRVAGGLTLFALAQRMLDFSNVVSDGLRQLDDLALLAEARESVDRDLLFEHDGKSRAWSPGADELLIGNMVIAAFGLAAAGEVDRLPLQRWRTDASSHSQAGRMLQLIDHLEGLFITGSIKPWPTVLKTTTNDWSHHASSALAAALIEPLGPGRLLATHALWVHYLQQPYHKPLVAHYMAYLVADHWRSWVATAALPGSDAPDLSLLIAALAQPVEGWARIKVVLQAALSIVALSSDDNARATIKGIEP